MGNSINTFIEKVRANLEDYETLLQFDGKYHEEFVRAAKLADLAYYDEDQLRKMSCRRGCDEQQVAEITIPHARELLGANKTALKPIKDDLTDAEAIVTCRDDKLVIAFRGTESLKDMMIDLHLKLTTWLEPHESDSPTNKKDEHVCMCTCTCLKGTCTVCSPCIHSGFKEQYLSVRRQVHDESKKIYAKSDNEILVTGHSLGGALATICALDLALTYPEIKSNIKLITTGAPPVGNEKFAELFKDEVPFCARLVKRWDLVPKLDFVPLTGLVHVGKKVTLRESSNSLKSLLPLTAHSAAGYITGAEKSQKVAEKKREQFFNNLMKVASTREYEPGKYRVVVEF